MSEFDKLNQRLDQYDGTVQLIEGLQVLLRDGRTNSQIRISTARLDDQAAADLRHLLHGWRNRVIQQHLADVAKVEAINTLLES